MFRPKRQHWIHALPAAAIAQAISLKLAETGTLWLPNPYSGFPTHTQASQPIYRVPNPFLDFPTHFPGSQPVFVWKCFSVQTDTNPCSGFPTHIRASQPILRLSSTYSGLPTHARDSQPISGLPNPYSFANTSPYNIDTNPYSGFPTHVRASQPMLGHPSPYSGFPTHFWISQPISGFPNPDSFSNTFLYNIDTNPYSGFPTHVSAKKPAVLRAHPSKVHEMYLAYSHLITKFLHTTQTQSLGFLISASVFKLKYNIFLDTLIIFFV